MLANKLMSALSGGAADKLYVDDVFSAYTYTGNGSTQTINTGIDLAGKGGLVWIKSRSNAVSHFLQDSARSNFGQSLLTQTTDAQFATTYITSVTSAGYSVSGNANLSGQSTVAWTFRKSPKFFDVVTGVGPGTFAHMLGVTPGMVIIKPSSIVDNWYVHHRSLTGGIDGSYGLALNAAVAEGATGTNHVHTDTTINVGGNIVAGSAAWVAYLFAHDPSADGIIQCGSYTTTELALATISLGFEPQFVMIKRVDSTSNWFMWDTSRRMPVDAVGGRLAANTATGESNATGISPTATGFKDTGSIAASATIIYLAIRRPNKPPTTGTEVYNHLTRTGTGAVGSTAAVGFAPDLAISQSISVGRVPTWVDRLRGVEKWLCSNGASSEETQTTSGLSSFDMLGVSYTVDNTEQPFAWNNFGEDKHQRFFRRAPGFMDVVCDTGTGTAHAITHNMTVAPELVIRKGRMDSTQWECWHAGITNTEKLVLNSTAAKATDTTAWNSTSPTAASFTVGTGANVNTNAFTYVTYLFATKAGISKVGSYTGNGTSQTINCGFTAGARFILIKRTNSTGDWYIWDTARGIISANDPHLSLNAAEAEVTTDDSVDPAVSGFIVNQVAATNINVSGATYIFLAVS